MEKRMSIEPPEFMEAFFWNTKEALKKELNLSLSIGGGAETLTASIAPMPATAHVAISLKVDHEGFHVELELNRNAEIDNRNKKQGLISQKIDDFKFSRLQVEYGDPDVLITKVVKGLAQLLQDVKRIDHV